MIGDQSTEVAQEVAQDETQRSSATLESGASQEHSGAGTRCIAGANGAADDADNDKNEVMDGDDNGDEHQWSPLFTTE